MVEYRLVIIMEKKIISHGTHVMNNDSDGYTYSLSVSDSTDFNSHMHKCYEFIHIIHGQLLYTVEGSEYMLTDGDIIMTRPEEMHSFSFPKACVYEREFLHIYPNFLKEFTGITKDIDSRKMGHFNQISAEVVRRYGLDGIFREIEECCARNGEDTDYLVLANSVRLISVINRIMHSEKPEPAHFLAGGKSNAVCRYIDRHYSEPLTVQSIADYMFLSPSHLSRMFKHDTGMTVRAYLNMRRITQAKNRIIQGQDSIKNIYWKCGFEDYSTFYRAFVKYAGMSPDRFRRSQNTI